MKKIISVIGVAAVALTMFLNVSVSNGQLENGDINLASVMGLNTANAEDCAEAFEWCDQWASNWGDYNNWSYEHEFNMFEYCFTTHSGC